MRLFVALGLPEPVRDEIRSWLLRTKASFPSARWVRPENAHLTLRFLSEVAEDRVSILGDALRIAFGRFERFALEIGRGGAFPSTRRARVLWLGATAEGDLAGVQGESAKAAETVLELPAEERSFHPHVTIARCRQPWRRTDVERWTAAVPLSFAGSFVVAEGVLVRSVLGPRGADYSVIERFPLAGESP